MLLFMLAFAAGLCAALMMIFIHERKHWALFGTVLCFIAILFLSNQVQL